MRSGGGGYCLLAHLVELSASESGSVAGELVDVEFLVHVHGPVMIEAGSPADPADVSVDLADEPVAVLDGVNKDLVARCVAREVFQPELPVEPTTISDHPLAIAWDAELVRVVESNHFAGPPDAASSVRVTHSDSGRPALRDVATHRPLVSMGTRT
jgi:hypothetical protein